MKNTRNEAMRALRKMIDQTQTEFAQTIGSSKDAVVSWELGRNRLSARWARRIALVTGVDESSLTKGSGALMTRYTTPKRPFTMAEYHQHQKTFWGHTPEENVRRQMRPCMDTLELLFLAAARSAAGEGCSRLPGLLDSFVQWCHEARADFELGEAIDAELAKRRASLRYNKSFREWRELAKTDPTMAREFRFKDNPKKGDEEMLELEMVTVPAWQPGQRMGMPKG